MNYIWDLLIKAKKLNIPDENIIFKYPASYSPYMELSFQNLNEKELEEETVIEVNPYYRFFNIFKTMFQADFTESIEFREVLYDILIHYLGGLDLKQGLYKEEYYKKFILKDILRGHLSENIRENINVFDFTERDIFLNHIITLYKTGESIELFKSIVKKIFKRSMIYLNKENRKEILIYLGEKRKPASEKKINMLLEVFLNIKYVVSLYWEYHFGVIGIANTMKIEEMVIY